jgi:type II secretory pathway component PulK
MALLLIAMAGSVLAIMARRSVFDASDVKQAELLLKQRWASYSLSRSLLPQAAELIKTFNEDNPDPDKGPLNTVRFEVQLGEAAYQVILSDEQAKANVNQLLKNKGNTSDTAQAIRSLMEAARVQDMPAIELKPYAWEDNPEIANVHTLGQVFHEVDPAKLLSNDDEQTAVLDALTCWTDGKLNIHTASPEVLKAVCTPLITRGQIDKLIDARKSDPKISLAAALTAAGIAKDNLEKIKPLFTDQSTFHSLWITARTDRRTRYWLTVAQQQKTAKNKSQTPHQHAQTGKLITADFEW